MPYLAVLGHTNIDVQLSLAEIPVPGASSPVLDRRTVYGGTAANIARHAAGLGVPVRLWSRVGTDFPPDWKVGLEDDGVDLAFMDMEQGGRTPTCFILTDAAGEQSYCMDQGAMAAMADHQPPMALLEGVEWLHVGTGDPAAYGDIMDAARTADVRVAFDPGQELRFMYTPKTFEALLDKSDVLFVNDVEMGLALQYLRYGDPVQLLDHVDAVIHTQGDQGATLYTGKTRHHAPAVPVAAVDPTGAGDALRAGWYAALHAGRSMQEAIAHGVLAASVCVQHLGPQSHTLRPADL